MHCRFCTSLLNDPPRHPYQEHSGGKDTDRLQWKYVEPVGNGKANGGEAGALGAQRSLVGKRAFELGIEEWIGLGGQR